MLFVKPLLPLPPLDPAVGCPTMRFGIGAPLVEGLPFVRGLPGALTGIRSILFGRHELRPQLHEVVGVALEVPEVHVVDLAVPAVATESMHNKAARPALEGRTFLRSAADAQLRREPVVFIRLDTRTSTPPVVVLSIRIIGRVVGVR